MSAMRASYFVTRVGAQLCALVLLWVLWLAVGATVRRTGIQASASGPLTSAQIAATGITSVDCSAITAERESPGAR
jgi:hypothetical protein